MLMANDFINKKKNIERTINFNGVFIILRFLIWGGRGFPRPISYLECFFILITFSTASLTLNSRFEPGVITQALLIFE